MLAKTVTYNSQNYTSRLGSGLLASHHAYQPSYVASYQIELIPLQAS